MEKAHRIYTRISTRLDGIPVSSTHLGQRVFVRKQYREHRACTNQILHLERVQVRIVGGLVVVEHQINGVCGSADEDDLEDGVVECRGRVEGPEEVYVSRYVYDEIEEL
jgi:hypothetical protein